MSLYGGAPNPLNGKLDRDYDRAREFERQNHPIAPPGLDPNTAEIHERVDHLVILCAAMWELLRTRTDLTENDLAAKVAEIDARDGVADGRITPKPQTCSQCQRMVFPRHRKCLYCGTDMPVDSLFKAI